MGRSRKKRSASRKSYSNKNVPTDNSSKVSENLDRGGGEKDYKISAILDEWKKIVGFFAACIAVISAFNIVLWALFSSGFKLEVSAYLLAHGMGGGAILFQPIVIIQGMVVLSLMVGIWLKNNRKYIFLYNDSKFQIFLYMIIFASFIALLFLIISMLHSTYNIFNDQGRLQLSLIPAVILICDMLLAVVAIIGFSVMVSTSEKIENSVNIAKKNRNNTIVAFCVFALLFSIASILPPSIMYYKGYGAECFDISKSSVSDRVLGSIPENNLTDGQRNKIRESLEESWSVRGEEGERFSIFVTREDKDTIDGVLFKKGDEDLRSKGKIVTINRKAIKTRDVCHQ